MKRNRLWRSVVEKRSVGKRLKISREEGATVGNQQRFAILLPPPNDRGKAAAISENFERRRDYRESSKICHPSAAAK